MSKVVFLAGPIEYWWDGNWETDLHWAYAAWRDALSRELVQRGYLVYRPHEAFKGAWDERAQAVNNAALSVADVVFVMQVVPPVPAQGTDGEVQYVAENTTARVVAARMPVGMQPEEAALEVVPFLDRVGLA